MQRRDLILAGGAAVVAGSSMAFAAAASPVVLELFTSQGCSSCPPADAFLAELAQRAGVVALSWHVDYWNNLGWRDPYASPEWTLRQRRYASRLNADVYTPALAVNGTRMVVGSDRAAVRAAIGAAAPMSVQTGIIRTGGSLSVRTGPRPATSTVTLIVYDPVHATSVRAGENSGRTLQEAHIVRSAVAVEIAAEGAMITLPAMLADQGAVLLVQDRDLAVLGATQLRAPSEVPL